jgi:hypothetical protein
MAGTGRRAVKDMHLRSLARWGCGFEYHQRQGCLSVLSVVCYQVEVIESG